MLSVLGSSALFTFIQFLIQRKDNKCDELRKLSEKIDAVATKTELAIGQLSNKIDENVATASRIHILKASDDIRRGMNHSEEYFDQLHQDINLYQKYCIQHPDFKNNKAIHAITNINRAYSSSLENNKFL